MFWLYNKVIFLRIWTILYEQVKLVLTLQQSDLSQNTGALRKAIKAVLTLQQSDLSQNKRGARPSRDYVLTLQQSDLSQNIEFKAGYKTAFWLYNKVIFLRIAHSLFLIN